MKQSNNAQLWAVAAGIFLLGVVLLLNVARREDIPLFADSAGVLDVLVALLTLAGGTLGVWLLYVRTRHSDETLRLAQETFQTGQRAELAQRFAKAIELLANESAAVRRGAIQMLRDVALQEPSGYGIAASDILVTFVETACRANWQALKAYVEPPQNSEQAEVTDEELRGWEEREFPDLQRTGADVVAGLTAIGDIGRVTAEARGDTRVFIRGIVLFDCALDRLSASGAFWSDAYLVDVRFYECDLTGVTWRGWGKQVQLIDCLAASADIDLTGSGARPAGELSAYLLDLTSGEITATQAIVRRSNLTDAAFSAETLVGDDSNWYRVEPPVHFAVTHVNPGATVMDRTGEIPHRLSRRGLPMFKIRSS